MYYINNEIETDNRFDTLKFLNFNDDNFDPLDSFTLFNIKNLSTLGSKEITNEEKRPDLLSYNIYEDTQYWWILLVYNDILDINELTSGKVIKYPSLNSIEYLYERASMLKKVV